ncbi:hypothetical protein ACFL96_12835 [Thermoproteota archaeon]
MGLAKTALAIGIAIVFAVFIAYGLFTIYEPPKSYYERSDCYQQFNCSDYHKKCAPDKFNESIEPRPYYPDDDCYSEVEANPDYQICMDEQDECEEAFEKTTERYRHSRNSFWILFVISLGAIIAGIFLNKLESIGSGLIGGGVLVLLWSLIYTARFWFQWNKYAKLLALGVVLVILVYLGYKKIEQKVVTSKKRRKR